MNTSKLKERIVHELKEFLVVSLFVAPFFLSFTAYRIYLLHGSGNRLFEYGAALVNALVLSKVILLGEIAGLGKRFESRPLIVSTIHKAAMFTILAMLFHVLEHTIRGVLHGQSFLGALYERLVIGREEVLVRAMVVFFVFIPFFALFETRRVMGEERFASLFLGRTPRSTEDSHADTREPTTLRT